VQLQSNLLPGNSNNNNKGNNNTVLQSVLQPAAIGRAEAPFYISCSHTPP